MNRPAVCVFCLPGVLLAAATPGLLAQPGVELKIGSRQLYVGEAVEIAIEISNFQTCEPPEIPELPDAAVRLAGGASDSSYTSIINGRITQSRTREYRGELTPRAAGELVIPPISVRVDGQVLKTREVRLTVRPSDADQLLRVDISTGRSRLYVGQRAPLTMTIWIKPARYGNQFMSAEQTLRQVNPIEFGPFPRQISNDPRRARPRPGGDPNDLFYAYEFITDFVAEHPGQLTFDEIEVGVTYPTPAGTRNLRAHPVVQPLEILPVPMENRPPNFNGAVGLLDIKTAAHPVSVRVGDPIELTIEIFGDGPIGTLPPPLLSANTKLAEGFRLPTEQLAGETQNARRRFRLTIRARRDDVTEIPPIEYPYFDPTPERFVVARSKPIPLTVAPAAEIALPDLSGTRTPQAASATTLQALDGLRDVETSEAALLATTDPVTPRLVTGVMLVPPALFLLAWAGRAYVQTRIGDPARRRRQAALRSARRRIARARAVAVRARSTSDGSTAGELAREIAAALTGYLADRLAEPPGHFTGAAALDFLLLRQVPPAVLNQWATLVQRCDEAAFAGGVQADGDALCTQALACLMALERQRL